MKKYFILVDILYKLINTVVTTRGVIILIVTLFYLLIINWKWFFGNIAFL